MSVTIAQNWITIPSGTTDQLNDIDFPSNNVGYAVGNNYNFLKTIDGGKTWTKSIPAGLVFMGTNNFTKVQFINDSIGFVMLENRGIYKTIDGGLNFTAEMMQGALCFPHDMFFFDEDNGYAAGGQCFAGESVDKKDAGMWGWSTTLNIQAQNMLHTISFRNTNLGLTAGTEGTFFRTNDAGISWDSVFTLSTGDSISSISWANDTLVYAATTNNLSLFYSGDAGLTWQQETNSATFFYPKMRTTSTNSNGYFVSGGYAAQAAQGLIYERKPWNTGWQWKNISANHAINGSTTFADSIAFVVGDSGLIMTNLDTSSIGSSLIKIDVPTISVYPNPVNDHFNIECQEKNVNITIYNIAGQSVLKEDYEVLTSVAVGKLPVGIYQILISKNSSAIGIARFVKTN